MSDATAAAPEAAAKDGEKAAAKGGKSKLLIIIAAAVLLLGGGGAGAYFFMHKSADDEVTADSDEGEHADDAKETKKEKGKAKGKKDKKGKAAEPKLPAIYVEFQPPFVVNFDAKGVMRFLQVSMQVMTRDHDTSELIKLHDPKIRNNMLLLLGSQTLDTISTMEAKEELRKKALETIVKIVDDEGGEGKKVEDLFFTSFVMQ
ncbi:MAG TPA: flagellar basal body-associated FliL family protein [Steroidobacteraceae bacterium]|jgi:flagellar FliL protein|nr:flagellar basal body-associated FliL family protein [Steroidobacteraceae bacterium]